MKTNPRVVKSLFSSSIVLTIVFGLSFCDSPTTAARDFDLSISRSVPNRTEVRETIKDAMDDYHAEYNRIYKKVAKAEADRIADPQSKQSKFVRYAKTFVGTPYWYGGSTPSGFDCSGFVGYVLKHQLGIEVRHSASSQMQLGTRVSKPLPGDLVGWGYGNYFHHIGIYVGDGKVIDALNPYRDLYVRELSTLNSWLGRPTFTRVIEPSRNFSPHKITKQIMQSKNESFFDINF